MALVPIIQPPVIRALTTRHERMIHMPVHGKKVSKTALILFPIVVTLCAAMVAPSSTALIGFLMFGNLIRECGVLNKLSLAAQNELASLVTILLGISISSTMAAERFVRLDTLMIIGLGLLAFIFDTAGGVLFAKAINLLLPVEKRINPMLGRLRDLRVSDVGAGHPRDGAEGRPDQLPADAGGERQRQRPDRIGRGRRAAAVARAAVPVTRHEGRTT